MVSTVKKKSNGYNYKYADLAQIHEELENQGITYYQYIDYDPAADADYIYTVIIRGDKEGKPLRGCRIIIGHEAKMSAAQAQGSALTYARRYSLLMALGWATEDDDGKTAGAPVPRQPRISIRDISYARDRLELAKDMNDLKSIFVSLSEDVRNHPEVVACKDAMKNKLAKEVLEGVED